MILVMQNIFLVAQVQTYCPRDKQSSCAMQTALTSKKKHQVKFFWIQRISNKQAD